MRFIHTSDWHLGQTLHGFDRGVEHDEFLDWLCRTLVERRVDALLVTGDVYDVINPPVTAQQRLYRFLRRALEESAGLQVVFIGGNHDSPARLELPRDLVDPERVFLVGSLPRVDAVPDVGAMSVRLRGTTGATTVACLAVPYLRPGDLPPFEGPVSPLARFYDEVVQAARAASAGLAIIVTGHLHMVGGEISEASERRIIVGGEEASPSSVFRADIAYVALGHLHRPQDIAGATTIRYAGAPFPMSISEHGYRHSVVLGDVGADGVVSHALIEIPRAVRFHRVPATGAAPLEEVEAELASLDLPDVDELHRAFLEVAVSIDGPQPGLRRRIEAAIESKAVRLVRVITVASGSDAAAGLTEVAEELSDLTPARVFELLHRQKFDSDPEPDVARAFAELLASLEVTEGGQEDAR